MLSVSDEKIKSKNTFTKSEAGPGLEKLQAAVEAKRMTVIPITGKARADEQALQEEDDSPWDIARERFPRTDFPDILPENIRDSLEQLARSHATSFLSLPGAAIAIFSSTLGRTITTKSKASWEEPLSFWFVDIRESGEGKSPAARKLCNVLYKAQEKAENEYRERSEAELEKKPKDRRPVPRARGYFATELTLEGLRFDLDGQGHHGGQVCILDELSAFLTAQNQYKGGKGSDREAWICIHDGKPARVVRATGSSFIKGARVSIFGGIQPKTWRRFFGGDDGLYLSDGTIFRFLPTIEGPSCHLLTDEIWTDQNREAWENTLARAMMWADDHCMNEGWTPFIIQAERPAWDLFRDWVNRLKRVQSDFPESFRGFLPKAFGYAQRFAGVLHCLHRFAADQTPVHLLSCKDMERGISAAEFYLSQAVDALGSIESEGCRALIDTTSENVKRLAVTLESMRGEVDSGKLSVGAICERFNKGLPIEQQIKSRAMGTLIRNCGLNIKPGKSSYRGQTGVSCFQWNKKTEILLSTSTTSTTSMSPTGERV